MISNVKCSNNDDGLVSNFNFPELTNYVSRPGRYLNCSSFEEESGYLTCAWLNVLIFYINGLFTDVLITKPKCTFTTEI